MLSHFSWKKFVCRYCSKAFSALELCENHEFSCGARSRTVTFLPEEIPLEEIPPGDNPPNFKDSGGAAEAEEVVTNASVAEFLSMPDIEPVAP